LGASPDEGPGADEASVRTTNHVDVALPRERVVDLYTCQELLPSWSPGLISFEQVGEGVFRQRYVVMGREIDERLTVVALDLPRRLHTRADSGGGLTRDSEVTFDALDEATTRVVVHNRFSGDPIAHLVPEDLHGYTQRFLEVFQAFAEGREGADPRG